jgi:hypothetical protein
MIKNGQTFSYEFCNTSEFGIYVYDYFTDEGDVYVNDFKVTPNGDDLGSGLSILLFISLVIILTLLILTIRGMIIVDDFGWNFGFLNIAYILLNIFFFVSWKIFSNYVYTIPSIGTALHAFWIISNVVWIPFILGQVAYILLKLTDEAQIKKLVKMGYTQDEAHSRVKRKK